MCLVCRGASRQQPVSTLQLAAFPKVRHGLGLQLPPSAGRIRRPVEPSPCSGTESNTLLVQACLPCWHGRKQCCGFCRRCCTSCDAEVYLQHPSLPYHCTGVPTAMTHPSVMPDTAARSRSVAVSGSIQHQALESALPVVTPVVMRQDATRALRSSTIDWR